MTVVRPEATGDGPAPRRAGGKDLRRLLDAVMTLGHDADLSAVLSRIVRRAVDLVDARHGALGVLDETGTRIEELVVPIGRGDSARRVTRDALRPAPGTDPFTSLLAEAGDACSEDAALREAHDGGPCRGGPSGAFLGVPISVRGEPFGNLYLAGKLTGRAFSEADEELVVALAAAAGIAIENARLHADLREMALVEDEERIARDLHDTVIQQLFTAGLSLQGARHMVRVDAAAAERRLDDAAGHLDRAIGQIRTAIFDLERSRGHTLDRKASATRDRCHVADP